MQHYLDSLRKKPKAVRAQVGFVGAATVTAVVCLIWAFGLSERMYIQSADPTIAEYQRAQEKLSEEKNKQAQVSFFEQLKRGVAAVIGSENPPAISPEPDTKTIDINALLQKPVPKKNPPPSTEEAIGSSEGSTGTTGSVILIGTTTRSADAETDE